MISLKIVGCFLGLTFVFTPAKAQWVDADISNSSIQTTVQANGTFFHKKGSASFEIDSQSGKNMLKYGSFWMLGIDNDEVYGSSSLSPNSEELWPGPIDTITGLPKDPSDWNKIWAISSEEINYHKQHYNESGYEPISVISNWPANHNESNVNPILAPFIDWNGDGIYDPLLGDYPDVPGKENVYFISNDGAGEHQISGTQKLGIELQGIFFSSPNEKFGHTVFADIFVVNRSDRSYEPFYFGNFSDFQLGNSTDNYCGTELIRNMIFGMNGDNMDEGSLGYGDKLPMAASLSLSHPMYASIAFNSSDSTRSFPKNSVQFRNVMEGKWRFGEDKTSVGNGTTTGNATKFMYSGNSDPLEPNASWFDSSSGDNPGERNMLSVFKLDSLPSNKYEMISMAFIAMTSDSLSLDPLIQLASEVINANGGPVSSYVPKKQSFTLYPNPIRAGEIISIRMASEDIVTIEMHSITGVKVDLEMVSNKTSKIVEVQCNEKVLEGIYVIRIQTKLGFLTKRVLVQTP
jgi:hypothetical protein